MFVNQHHLQHLLRPDQYTSESQYRSELRHLFQPAWHPICARSQLRSPGDFLTLELLGTPILLRTFEGELRAFLNVCPHRHSRLTDREAGNTRKLRCQYHGWEFQADGRTGQIPDARAFRPWDRENSCLRKFRLETCGNLVFVNLSDDAPPLRDWLGPLWPVWEPSFGDTYRFVAKWEADFPCNWKVVLENSLESYHIPEVHPYTFKTLPAEANSWHELEPEFSTFKTIQPVELVTRMQNWFVRRLGEPVTAEYWHRVRHPHLTGSSLDSFRMMQAVYPTGPQTCRYRSLMFVTRGLRRNPLAWMSYQILRLSAILIGKRVFAEDAAIYAGVQKGLAASPHRGVIGTREERIYTFQEYVLDRCNGPIELPTISSTNGSCAAAETPISAERPPLT